MRTDPDKIRTEYKSRFVLKPKREQAKDIDTIFWIHEEDWANGGFTKPRQRKLIEVESQDEYLTGKEYVRISDAYFPFGESFFSYAGISFNAFSKVMKDVFVHERVKGKFGNFPQFAPAEFMSMPELFGEHRRQLYRNRPKNPDEEVQKLYENQISDFSIYGEKSNFKTSLLAVDCKRRVDAFSGKDDESALKALILSLEAAPIYFNDEVESLMVKLSEMQGEKLDKVWNVSLNTSMSTLYVIDAVYLDIDLDIASSILDVSE